MSVKHIDYRGDIQIYRAIAVLEVLLFHMGVPGLSSGFLGVDIFFVISGYLMTILYTDRSTALEFYQRRARRLLPAYFATIGLTLIAAFFITIPTDFGQVGSQAVFASALSSNFGFFLQNSYFSKAEFNPLLHLWSLGVECQFYLFFPLIILVASKWKAALPTVLIASIALCFALVMISPKAAFFMLPARIWEFSIGMWAASRPRATPKASWLGLIGVAGMLLIPLLPVQGEQRSILYGHPGMASFLISCATAMALIFRLPPGVVASTAGKLAQKVGDFSYSLYLAHWPVLVLIHYVPFGGTQAEVIGLPDAVVSSALIMVATALLYRLFERPGPRLFTSKRAVAAAALVAVAGLALPLVQVQRFDRSDRQIFAAWADRDTYRCGKVFRLTHPGDTICEIGDGDRGTVMLIGDSHSDAIKKAFARSASEARLRTFFSVDNNPLSTPGLDGAWLKAQARQKGPRAVFLHYSSANLNAKLVQEARDALAGTGVRLFVILPAPDYPDHVPQQLYMARHRGAPAPAQDISAYRRALAHKAPGLDRLAGVEWIQTAALFCRPNCQVTNAAGDLLYFDAGHLTLTGADVLVPAIKPALASVAERR